MVTETMFEKMAGTSKGQYTKIPPYTARVIEYLAGATELTPEANQLFIDYISALKSSDSTERDRLLEIATDKKKVIELHVEIVKNLRDRNIGFGGPSDQHTAKALEIMTTRPEVLEEVARRAMGDESPKDTGEQ
jgi:hypothetical protein